MLHVHEAVYLPKNGRRYGGLFLAATHEHGNGHDEHDEDHDKSLWGKRKVKKNACLGLPRLQSTGVSESQRLCL
jgi:hypothetical protein